MTIDYVVLPGFFLPFVNITIQMSLFMAKTTPISTVNVMKLGVDLDLVPCP
jgi:hypothetical protein